MSQYLSEDLSFLSFAWSSTESDGAGRTLEDLVSTYPIIDCLVRYLSLGELLSLARVNTVCRARLHGFSTRGLQENKNRPIRPELRLGKHQTALWQALKAKCRLICSDNSHTMGSRPRGCRMCSMPVCEACIIRSSLATYGNIHSKRQRYLCQYCWFSGKPLRTQLVTKPQPDRYVGAAEDFPGFCACSVSDGWLCQACKQEQYQEAETNLDKCAGWGCSKQLSTEEIAGRVCLWCSLSIPGRISAGERRREYSLRYHRARLHSTIDNLGECSDQRPETPKAPWMFLQAPQETASSRKERFWTPFWEQRHVMKCRPRRASEAALTFPTEEEAKVAAYSGERRLSDATTLCG